jgi:multiple sugar transport system permease protein
MTEVVSATQSERPPAPSRRGRGPGRNKPSWRRSESIPGIAFLAPFLIFLIVFQYLPLVMLGRDSFFSYSLLNPSAAKFVGTDNFKTAFTDPDILQSYRSTLFFIVGMLILVIPLGMLTGVYLDGRLPARAIVRVLVFLPVVTSSVVTTTIFGFLLGEPGLLDEIFGSIGIHAVPFLTGMTWARLSIIAMSAWQELGLAAVLFLGGLQSIPEEVREAARVDGAGWWRELRSITIPLLSRTTMFVTVLVTVFGLQVFAPPLLLTGGGPQGSTNFITYNIYQTAFQLEQPGLAAAISIVLLVAALLISGIQMRLLRTRWNY